MEPSTSWTEMHYATELHPPPKLFKNLGFRGLRGNWMVEHLPDMSGPHIQPLTSTKQQKKSKQNPNFLLKFMVKFIIYWYII